MLHIILSGLKWYLALEVAVVVQNSPLECTGSNIVLQHVLLL